MKRSTALLVIVLGSVMLYAQDGPRGHEMTGTICDSKCVTQIAGQSSCDLNCTQKGGDPVFVEDNGRVTKVANPEKCQGNMMKRVKVMCDMTPEHTMTIYEIYSLGPG
jgi:hypothetical protein